MSRKKRTAAREAGPPGGSLSLSFSSPWCCACSSGEPPRPFLGLFGRLPGRRPQLARLRLGAQGRPGLRPGPALRPPGNAYLVAILWDGTTAGFSWLKLRLVPHGRAGRALPLQGHPRRLRLPGRGGRRPGRRVRQPAPPGLDLDQQRGALPPAGRHPAGQLAGRQPVAERAAAARLGPGERPRLPLPRRAPAFFLLATAALIAFSWRHDRVGTTWKAAGRRLAFIAGAAILTLLPWHLEGLGGEPRLQPRGAQGSARHRADPGRPRAPARLPRLGRRRQGRGRQAARLHPPHRRHFRDRHRGLPRRPRGARRRLRDPGPGLRLSPRAGFRASADRPLRRPQLLPRQPRRRQRRLLAQASRGAAAASPAPRPTRPSWSAACRRTTSPSVTRRTSRRSITATPSASAGWPGIPAKRPRSSSRRPTSSGAARRPGSAASTCRSASPASAGGST